MSAPAISMEDIPLSNFLDVVNVNLIGPFLCTREAFRVFKSQSPLGGKSLPHLSFNPLNARIHLIPDTQVESSTMARLQHTHHVRTPSPTPQQSMPS